MDMLSLIPDNLSELLVKILQFTEQRRDLLYRNIHNTRTPGFIPQDMPVLEFAGALNGALAEHVHNHRLLFCDTENITFGPNSLMQIAPIADTHAETLLREDRDEYLEWQVNKLLENSLNRKVAAELLRFNQDPDSGLPPSCFAVAALNDTRRADTSQPDSNAN